MLKLFRLTSLLEGLSYLAILAVTFGVIGRDYVFPLGVTHGALFLIYIVLSLPVSHKQGWPFYTWLLLFAASLVPFAFIGVEIFLRSKIEESASEPAGEALG